MWWKNNRTSTVVFIFRAYGLEGLLVFVLQYLQFDDSLIDCFHRIVELENLALIC